MQFFTFPILAILATGSLAMPNNLNTGSLEARADCDAILPACNGGSISGQTNCRCDGQDAPCDVWNCPDNKVMVCGQSSTGCVWI